MACGFQPLYGTSDTGGGRDALAHTQIKPIADRSGQQLRNHLLDLMTPRGQSPTPLYTLAVSLSESTNHIAVRKTALATRANFNLTASFILTDTATGRVLYGDKTQVLSGYNILISDFATLQSVKDARARALREAAEQIRVRLGVFFDQHYNSGSAAP
ncbi:MAG: LPS assembly lipoprotein LptE [Rhodospirillales bacterium]|nr:LPS assembly lipoprotein LptE [Rhodospirillales bacterium]